MPAMGTPGTGLHDPRPAILGTRTSADRRARYRCSERVVRGGVEPPTFRFSGSGTFLVTGTSGVRQGRVLFG